MKSILKYSIRVFFAILFPLCTSEVVITYEYNQTKIIKIYDITQKESLHTSNDMTGMKFPAI